jgi:glycosyltransferase involved in cell wall biosynthesis
MDSIVSVIIPVYNVEKYLEECLNSVVRQTYKNLEIICIDDCSTDNSLEMLERMAKKDDRIKVVRHKVNTRQGKARNEGIMMATGRYAYFMDSDDFLDLDHIEKLVNSIVETGVDLVCNNCIMKYYGYRSPNNKFMRKINDLPLNKKLVFEEIFLKKILVQPTAKLYKLSLLKENKIFFDENLRFEDFYFLHILKTKIKTICFTYNSVYYYRQSENSTMGVYRKKQTSDLFDPLFMIVKLYQYYKENNLLNKYKIPFSWLNKFFLRQKNKNKFFREVRRNLLLMKDDIDKNRDLYNRKNLLFFDCVINSGHYAFFRIKYLFLRIF